MAVVFYVQAGKSQAKMYWRPDFSRYALHNTAGVARANIEQR